MKKVKINDHQTLFVEFERKRKSNSYVTNCRFYTYSNDKIVLASGSAFCSPKDNFNGSDGRKISFSRAVTALLPILKEHTPQQIQQIKNDRRCLWAQAFDEGVRMGQPKGFKITVEANH